MTVSDVITDSQLSDLQWKYKNNEEVSWIISCLKATREEDVSEHIQELDSLDRDIEDLRDQLTVKQEEIDKLNLLIEKIRKAAA